MSILVTRVFTSCATLAFFILAAGSSQSVRASGVNVALAANGGVATASSTYGSGYPVAAVNNGDRKGLNWGAGGGWSDATANAYSDWVQIDFSTNKMINEIDLFTLQDNYTSPVTPTLSMQFSQYGVTDFEVQYWTGSAWVDVPGGNVTGNRNVWRQFLFANITTNGIRVVVSHSLTSYSRIVEIEAYQAGGSLTPTLVGPQFWIAVRTDGLPGAGTQSDPFDGSSAAKFDALMQSFPSYALIHLAAGTFLTNGITDVSTGTGFSVKKGQQIIGAGMDVTTVKLMHVHSLNNGQKYLGDTIACGYNEDGSDSLLSDITVDCNASYFISTYQTNAVQAGAGGLRGNNCTIRNVHVIHAYGSQAGRTEGSALYVDTYSNGTAWQSVVGELIENCLVDQSAGDYGGGISLLNQGNTLGLGTTTSGVVQNNTVKNWAGTSAYGFMGKDIVFTGNAAIDCSLFIYGDTGTNDHITISGNTAICGLGNAASASGGGGFVFFNKSAAGASFNNVLIENNTVTVRPLANTNPDLTFGLLFLTGGTPGLASNYVVRNNRVSLDPRSPAITYSAWELHGVNTISIYGNSYDRTPITYFDLTVTNFTLNGVLMH
jgi:hypothetical protein